MGSLTSFAASGLGHHHQCKIRSQSVRQPSSQRFFFFFFKERALNNACQNLHVFGCNFLNLELFFLKSKSGFEMVMHLADTGKRPSARRYDLVQDLKTVNQRQEVREYPRIIYMYNDVQFPCLIHIPPGCDGRHAKSNIQLIRWATLATKAAETLV